MIQRQQHTHRFRSLRPLVRSLGVVGAAIAICGGVTYAALQSQQATLTNNTIQSATANLRLSQDGANFADTLGGFTFANVEPGGDPMPAAGNMVWLRNMGSVPLGLHLALDSTGMINTSQLDLTKVMAVVTPVNGNGSLGTPVSTALSALATSITSGGTDLTFTLPIGAAAQYKLQVSMAVGAYTGAPGGGATLSGVNLVFTGVSTSHQS